MRSVTLGKTRYKVRVVKDAQRHKAKAGFDSPFELHGYLDKQRKRIVVREDEPEEMASTVLHEMLHALFPYLDEDAIAAAEESLAPVLWRHGFRPF